MQKVKKNNIRGTSHRTNKNCHIINGIMYNLMIYYLFSLLKYSSNVYERVGANEVSHNNERVQKPRFYMKVSTYYKRCAKQMNFGVRRQRTKREPCGNAKYVMIGCVCGGNHYPSTVMPRAYNQQ